MSTATLHYDASLSHVARTRGPAPAPASESWGSMRLTRRGRLLIVLAVLAVALGVFTSLGSPAVSTGTEHHATAEQVVVEPGQTLWDIAVAAAPGEDPRDVIAEIVDLNALSSAGAIRAGQLLYLPTD